MKKILFFIAAFLLMAGVSFATVTTTANSIAYTCSGTTGPFPFTFPVTPDAVNTLGVVITDLNGSKTILTPAYYTTKSARDYTGNYSYYNGGSITLNNICSVGSILTISRNTPETQVSSFTEGMPTLYNTFERALDKNVMMIQDCCSSSGSGGGSGGGTNSLVAGVMGTTGQICTKGIGVNMIDCATTLPPNSGGGNLAPVDGGVCATTYNLNPANGDIFNLTLNGACNIIPANPIAGQSFILEITQSSIVAPTFYSLVTWPSGTQPTWSTTVGEHDLVACVAFGTSAWFCNGLVGFLPDTTAICLNVPTGVAVTTPYSGDQTWGYIVTAVDAQGNESGNSTEATLSTGSAWENYVNTGAYNTLTWNAVDKAVSYNIYRTTVPAGGSTGQLYSSLAALTFTDSRGPNSIPVTPTPPVPAPYGLAVTPTGANNSQTWTYLVVASNGASVSATTSNGASWAVYNIHSTTNYNTLTWLDVTGATSYQIFRTAGPAGATLGLIASGIEGHTYVDTK
jgi:hypothetical protein